MNYVLMCGSKKYPCLLFGFFGVWPSKPPPPSLTVYFVCLAFDYLGGCEYFMKPHNIKDKIVKKHTTLIEFETILNTSISPEKIVLLFTRENQMNIIKIMKEYLLWSLILYNTVRYDRIQKNICETKIYSWKLWSRTLKNDFKCVNKQPTELYTL